LIPQVHDHSLNGRMACLALASFAHTAIDQRQVLGLQAQDGHSANDRISLALCSLVLVLSCLGYGDLVCIIPHSATGSARGHLRLTQP
jgi:hypothetical protein